MKILTKRQKEVLKYLEGKDWTSPTEIGMKVWGFGYHSSSASPVCKRLVKYGYIERNHRGHYRLARKEMEMKLWLLRAKDKELPNDDNPWKPWFDKALGHVVRADTEEEAREIAHENAGEENLGEFLGKEIAKTKQPWLDPKYSTCIELLPDGERGLVMKDFHAS